MTTPPSPSAKVVGCFDVEFVSTDNISRESDKKKRTRTCL